MGPSHGGLTPYCSGSSRIIRKLEGIFHELCVIFLNPFNLNPAHRMCARPMVASRCSPALAG